MDQCARCGYALHNPGCTACPECGLSTDAQAVAAFRFCRDRRRALWVGGALLVAASSCCITTSVVTPFGPNLGFPFGYYGDLNRVKWRVRSIEGVTIEQVRANYDRSVEEFTITVLIDGRERDFIYFPEGSLEKLLKIVEDWENYDLPRHRR